MIQLPPWERLLWSGRPWRLARDRYLLTDFRLIRIAPAGDEEIAIDDISDVQRLQSRLDRFAATSTIVVLGRNARDRPLVLASIRKGAQLAALIELLAGDPQAPRTPDAALAALAWTPRSPSMDLRGALGGIVAVIVALFAVVIGLHGKTSAVTFTPDDAIEPNGQKRSAAEIVHFMETEVMPWARRTLGPLKGGADRVTCGTCHGGHAAARGWQMPAVAALPQPDLRNRGWETYTTRMDAQMRNAIYGYLAESENQARARYMREMVVPGMAKLLRRPAYDFTKSYDYNRSQRALGCYHCHRVK